MRRPSAPVKCTSVTADEAEDTSAPSSSTVPTASTSTRRSTLPRNEEKPVSEVCTVSADLGTVPSGCHKRTIAKSTPTDASAVPHVKDNTERDQPAEASPVPVTTERF